MLKYRTCSLGDRDASKVSQKSDAVRAKLKKTSLRIVQKKKLFKRPRKKPQGSKQQKMTREQQDKRAPSMESREEMERAEVRMPPRTWSPRLEMDGAAIPYNASIREYNRGRVSYIAEALEQPVLLPRDMKAYR